MPTRRIPQRSALPPSRRGLPSLRVRDQGCFWCCTDGAATHPSCPTPDPPPEETNAADVRLVEPSELPALGPAAQNSTVSTS